MYYVFGCKEIHRRLLNNFKSPNDVEGRESIISKAIFIVHVATSNVLEMFSVRESTADCMLQRTPLLLLPINSFSLTSKSRPIPVTRPL